MLRDLFRKGPFQIQSPFLGFGIVATDAIVVQDRLDRGLQSSLGRWLRSQTRDACRQQKSAPADEKLQARQSGIGAKQTDGSWSSHGRHQHDQLISPDKSKARDALLAAISASNYSFQWPKTSEMSAQEYLDDLQAFFVVKLRASATDVS
jgi:hypothetical protein